MFASFADVVSRVSGRSVAIVGGGPSSLTNEPGFVDSHDLVVRVNNYKTGEAQGRRCDIFYSFFGGSIKKSLFGCCILVSVKIKNNSVKINISLI